MNSHLSSAVSRVVAQAQIEDRNGSREVASSRGSRMVDAVRVQHAQIRKMAVEFRQKMQQLRAKQDAIRSKIRSSGGRIEPQVESQLTDAIAQARQLVAEAERTAALAAQRATELMNTAHAQLAAREAAEAAAAERDARQGLAELEGMASAPRSMSVREDSLMRTPNNMVLPDPNLEGQRIEASLQMLALNTSKSAFTSAAAAATPLEAPNGGFEQTQFASSGAVQNNVGEVLSGLAKIAVEALFGRPGENGNNGFGGLGHFTGGPGQSTGGPVQSTGATQGIAEPGGTAGLPDPMAHRTNFLTMHDPNGKQIFTHLYPSLPAEQRAMVRAELKKQGYTHLYMYAVNEKDYGGGNSFDFLKDPEAYRSILQELRDDGIAPVVWMMPDDAPRYNHMPLSEVKSLWENFVSVNDDLVSSYVLGLEIDEYWSRSDHDAMGNHLNGLTDKPIFTHYTSGKYEWARQPWVDGLIYQYGFGRSASEVAADTLKVMSALPNKTFIAGEYAVREDAAHSRNLGQAAMDAGAHGFGNGGPGAG